MHVRDAHRSSFWPVGQDNAQAAHCTGCRPRLPFVFFPLCLPGLDWPPSRKISGCGSLHILPLLLSASVPPPPRRTSSSTSTRTRPCPRCWTSCSRAPTWRAAATDTRLRRRPQRRRQPSRSPPSPRPDGPRLRRRQPPPATARKRRTRRLIASRQKRIRGRAGWPVPAAGRLGSAPPMRGGMATRMAKIAVVSEPGAPQLWLAT